MMGLEEQCPFCPMRELGGRDSYTTQVDNGSQVFSVKTKRIQWEGQDAFIEYATDITAVSRAQQIFETQLHALLSSIPEAQGVFHLNLTQDQVLTMTGTSSNVEPLKTLLQVDALVESVASFIPDNAAAAVPAAVPAQAAAAGLPERQKRAAAGAALLLRRQKHPLDPYDRPPDRQPQHR